MKTCRYNTKLFLGCALLSITSGCAKLTFTPVPIPSNDAAAVVSPEPTPPPEPQAPLAPPTKTVQKTEVVAYGNKQVDFLIVLDDSNSMLPELKKLAVRMSTFVNSLEASNIDWQMCLTTTRGQNVGGKLVYGLPLSWANYTASEGTPTHVLKKGTANLNTIFTSTIDSLSIGGGSSGDERAIKATHDNFQLASSNGCYRSGAAISVIAISDEDERSVGGKPEKIKAKDASTALQPLESEDLPETMLNKARNVFNEDVRFTFNSIIVKPDDAVCENEQDLDTSPSHPGFIYSEASRLTDGGVGSICDADYGANLNTFKDKIVNSLTALNLECAPLPNSVAVKVNGQAITEIKVDGKNLKFEHPLLEGTEIELKYECPN